MLWVWSPVRVVCPNHKVVVLQPRTGNAPDLGSVANFKTFYFVSPRPICFNRCYGYFSFPVCPNASPSVAVRRCTTSLFHPLPISSPSMKLHPPVIFPPPLPAILCRLSLRQGVWFIVHRVIISSNPCFYNMLCLTLSFWLPPVF